MSYALSWVDIVTKIFVSVNLNFVFPVADQVKKRLISQLIKGISRGLQKVLKNLLFQQFYYQQFFLLLLS